jgi:hypothetical protein
MGASQAVPARLPTPTLRSRVGTAFPQELPVSPTFHEKGFQGCNHCNWHTWHRSALISTSCGGSRTKVGDLSSEGATSCQTNDK